jgi:beta-glucosidase
MVVTAATPASAGGDDHRRPVSPPVAVGAPFTPRVRALLAQLTLDEKISLVHATPDPSPLGQAGYTAGVPRLGIPPRRDADALGVNVWADATGLPTRLGVAAAFDRDASTRLGQLEGTEGRALGIDMLYGPQSDLDRLPNWGRNLTTLGEDPYLSAALTVPEVNGIQSTGLMDEPKHFAIYNGQNQNIPSVVDDQTAHQLYLAPFEAAANDAPPAAFMCSYATFQITPVESSPNYACENAGLLNGILRAQWDFRGFVLSDYGATHSVSIQQGLDTSFPNANFFGAPLKALTDPTSPTYDPAYAAALDTSVARILYQYERFGLLDNPTRPAFDKAAGIRTSRSIAEETAVLLKNDGRTLPLGRDDLGRGVAVIGPTADLLPASPGGERSRGFGDRNLISPLKALRAAEPHANIAFAPGLDRVGTVVPSTALSTPDGTPGLLRSQSDSTTTRVDATLDFTTTNPLTPGVSYTWTGTLTVPTTDTYSLRLQNQPAVVNAAGVVNPTGGGAGPGGPAASTTLTVDGANQPLATPSTILANTYPGGTTLNGQYFGLNNRGTSVPLTAGSHTITITYAVPANQVAPVVFRFTWSPIQASIDAAVAAARHARTAVVFADDANTTSPAGGVANLGAGQDQLIAAVAAANPNTVVVLNTGNPVLMPWLDSVKSVLEMWYPGQEGGTATANLLLGKAVPGGKLPITFPVSSDQTPFAGHPERVTGANGQITWSEGLFMGYRWYDANDVAPLFPFGFGLSYTSFDYSKLRVAPTRDGGLRVSFRVRNVGRYRGAEVPQVYVGPSPDVPADVQQAQRQLVQFDRITLDPGDSDDVTLTIAPRQLSYWSTATQQWVLGGGRRTIYVGPSSRQLPLTVTAAINPH